MKLINEDNSTVTLIETGGDVLVNGTEVDKKLELGHGDRIIFGNNHMYVLYHPQVRVKTSFRLPDNVGIYPQIVTEYK